MNLISFVALKYQYIFLLLFSFRKNMDSFLVYVVNISKTYLVSVQFKKKKRVQNLNNQKHSYFSYLYNQCIQKKSVAFIYSKKRDTIPTLTRRQNQTQSEQTCRTINLNSRSDLVLVNPIMISCLRHQNTASPNHLLPKK